MATAVDLTQFPVRFRYPGEEQPGLEEAREWLELARKTCQEVRLRLPTEATD